MRHPLKRATRIVSAILGTLLLLPILAVALLAAALNTDPGRAFAQDQVASLTGGTVRLRGLAGRFPDHLRLDHLEVSDSKGPYLTADGIVLDWSPLALLHRQALIDTLTATAAAFTRLPTSDPAAAPAPSSPDAKPFQLPLRVTVRHLALGRVALGAPILGTAATASLDGSADLPTLQTGSATIAIARLDSPGTYTLTGTVAPDRTEARLAVAEPDGGLIARLAALPAIGPLALQATIAGPQSALSTTLDLSAGPLTAAATGTIDLPGSRLALDVSAKAPPMRPAEGVAWQAIALQAHVAGPFTAPDATGHLQVDALQAQGAAIQRLTADLAGNAGQVTVAARAAGLQVPGPQPGLFAAAPVAVDVSARLDTPDRPVTFKVTHPLIAVSGKAQTGGALSGDATLDLPDLAPLAAIANLVMAGNAHLSLHAAQAGNRAGPGPGTGPNPGTGASEGTTLTANGTIGLTAGPAPAPALIGPAATIAVAAQLATGPAGTTVTVTNATIKGAAISLEAHGGMTPAGIDATARLALPDLSLAAPSIAGQATLDAHATGPLDRIALDARIAGDVGAPGLPKGPVTLTANLTGLPTAPTGRIAATGTLEGAPVDLALVAARDAAGTLHATIERADWRSLHAEGALTLTAGETIPQGRVALRFAQLADLRPFIGQPIAGTLAATLVLDPAAATLDAELRNAGLPGTQLGHAVLKARVTDPMTRPVIAASLAADGIDASGTTGTARLAVDGPQDALAIKAQASLTASGTPAQITAAALLDAPGKRLRLQALQIEAKPPGYAAPETVRLQSPATVSFADAVSVDRLRLALRSTTLEVAGRLSPSLDAAVTLRANLADVPLPGPPATGGPPYEGTVTLDAKLTGTPAAPAGTVRLAASNLRARTGPGRAVPPASLTATAQLAGKSARIDARLAAGSASIALNGQAPLGQGPLALHATGGLDLALFDPILTAQGRRARGRLTLDATVAGTTAAPAISGQAQLADGEIQDFSQGIRLHDIAATLRAEGQTIRLTSLAAKAGPGTIAASGTIGILAPGIPVDLVLTARNARPLASDTVTADLDADLTVKGQVAAGLQAAGKVTVRRATLNIPATLPASVAVLDVHRPGDKPPAPAAPAAPIGLDLAIAAPGQVFVRGRGLDAEMAGTLAIRGSSAQPQVNGGLEMRRGTISVAGTTLTFSRGKVGFDGTGVSGKIDPTLDFAADSTTSSVTATLAITGYVSKPKITLSSVPDLPQDEVLAYLVFKRSAKDLGPFQIAQIAAGLVELTGVGGSGGFNPLESVRKGLGLDRLSVGGGGGTGSSSSTATVEAGRYVANGVYVGAKQGTSGNQTQATVQIDLTKGLKLETDVGSGQGGNQVGLTYQFEY